MFFSFGSLVLAKIDLLGLAKTHARGVVGLYPLDLEIASGELLVVLGPSGSGKSTLLRLIAGLDRPTSGRITIAGLDMAGVLPRDRDLAMVFQNPALYPHLSVFENLAFPLRSRGRPRGGIAGRVREVARALEIEPLLDRKPASLSGGERQRVALGRAVVREPRIILLDEPFSSLDPPLKVALRERLLDLHRGSGATLVLVTHDQQEALMTADRIAVLNQGKLLQHGDPRTIYKRPADRFVAAFIGSPALNLIPCRIEAEDDRFRVHVDSFEPPASWPISGEQVPRRAPHIGSFELGLRPESIRIGAPSHRSDADGPRIRAVVDRLEYNGAEVVARLIQGSWGLAVRLDANTPIREGEAVELTFDPAQAVWFDAHGRGC